MAVALISGSGLYAPYLARAVPIPPLHCEVFGLQLGTRGRTVFKLSLESHPIVYRLLRVRGKDSLVSSESNYMIDTYNNPAARIRDRCRIIYSQVRDRQARVGVR